MKFNLEPDRVAAGLGLTLGSLLVLGWYWLRDGHPTRVELQQCATVYDHGEKPVCVIQRVRP